MLRQWLHPTPVDEFVGNYLGRVPHARPGAAGPALPLFSFENLERILASGAADLLVVAGGKHLDVPPPRDLPQTRALMQEGLGFVIRRGERHDPGLAALARDFARDLPGEVHLQLFVTPGGTQGFGWHWDFEEVFIAQTAGIKDYYFRDNTVDRHTPYGTQPDFERFHQERSPLHTSRLLPGDWLHVPARWWHMAKCLEDSLSISVGVRRT
jgi:50S ribosomal protein L16 3-hydroxylase